MATVEDDDDDDDDDSSSATCRQVEQEARTLRAVVYCPELGLANQDVSCARVLFLIA